MRTLASITAVILTVLSFSAPTPAEAADNPPRFNYQARLSDSSGDPLTGNHTLFFALYQGGTSSGDGTRVYEETVSISADNGVVSHVIGTGANQLLGPLTLAIIRVASVSDLFVQVAIDTDINVVLPRTRIEPVPYALTAGDTDTRSPILSSGVFPIVLSVPGSYYLPESITGIATQPGILVTTSGVTIDLNGNALIGALSGLTTADAIQVPAAPPEILNLRVRNGTISGWGGSGIKANGASGAQFTDLIVSSNSQYGIYALSDCIAANCTAIRNNTLGGCAGIYLDAGALVRNCVASQNTTLLNQSTYGIRVGDASSVLDCVVRDNDTLGIVVGISANIGCTITNNLVSDNRTTGNGNPCYGINAAGYATISGNTCNNNSAGGMGSFSYGIAAGRNCHVSNNVCNTNTAGVQGTGIFVQQRSRVEFNQCNGNTGVNFAYGIRVNTSEPTVGACVIIENSTSGNTGSTRGGIRFDQTDVVNYVARNILEESTTVSQPGINIFPTGDNANITF